VGGSEKNWGGQMFEFECCGGVRSLNLNVVGGSEVSKWKLWGGQKFKMEEYGGVKYSDS